MKNFDELLDLSGQTAVVTGGSRGIGLGITRRLAQAGANVVIASITDEEMENAKSELEKEGIEIKYVKTDVSKEEDVKNMIKFVVDEYGSLDILVNNAGVFPSKALEEMTTQDFEWVIDVNLKGVFLGTKYGSEQMKKQGKGGKIINITSIAALTASVPGLSHYDASKHGAWGFTKSTARELATHGIQVNAVAPGAIGTPGMEESQKGGSSEKVDMSKSIEEFVKKIPMNRVGDSDEIGKATLFLASDMSSYMTGEQIVVDGGFMLS